ncbi:MAG TPA: membrane dipeptidase [Bryobacteraceae bacterium]|nr:membrane dipeptidase [Bryobacteraceae bacterium]
MGGVLKNYDSSLSRRGFLTTGVGTGGAMLLGPAWLNAAADGVDPRVAQVMSGTIGIDMHNHVYPAGTEPHPQHAQPSRQEEQEQAPALFLAEEIKRSGLTAVCASYVLDFAGIDKPGDARDHFLGWLTAVDAQLEKGHMRRALNLKDLQAAHKHGQPTIVQTVEGAQFIEGRLERVEEVYKRGVRHLQLLHQQDDLVSPLGDVITSPVHLGGLTAFGAKVVKECNRLGILVDLAHASPETVLGALKVATQPVIVSHTGLDSRTGGNPRMAEMMKSHLISKEHAKVVAGAGGVIGVWTKLAGSPKEFVENIKAMVDAVGIDHVGIGTDTDLLSSRVGQGTNKAWPGLSGGFFHAVAGEMLLQGFTPDEIGKAGGGNYCRVFGKATAGHA